MPCPDIDEFERYLANGRDDSSASGLAAHLAACSECSSRLAELEKNREIEKPVQALLAGRMAAVAALPGEIGGYRIVRELGRGGMGIVYEAEQQRPRRRAALKVLSPGCLSSAALRRFEHEAQILARLQHACIAHIYEAGVANLGGVQRPFFAMEYVEGEPLTRHAEARRLSTRRRLELMAQVCEAVHYAHQKGVIHRDLKPANVLVDPGGRPRVLDFGVARVSDSDLQTTTLQTDVSQLIGTIPYMSPEQACGDPHELDTRSDVYALGVLMYELLAGRIPYELRGRTIPDALRVIREQNPTPLSSAAGGTGGGTGVPARELARELRGDIETIVAKALEKDKARRYQSAAELAADIRRYLAREPIAARPAGTWYQLGKFAQRNRALVASIAISFVALAGAATAAIRQAVVATRERDAAERRLAYARQAANFVLWGVGSSMGQVLGTRHLQRHLAEEAYVFHRRLADENPDDPVEQVGLWRALNALCLHSVEIGDTHRARVLWQMLHGEVERVATLHPEHPEVERGRAQLQHLLATIAEFEGDLDAAAQHGRDALELRRGRAARYDARIFESPGPSIVPETGPEAGEAPEHMRDRGGVAVACLALARWSQDADEIESCVRQAQGIIQELMEIDPTREPVYRSQLSEHAPLAGPVLLRNPSGPHYQRMIAEGHALLGDAARLRGDSVGAERQHRTALRLREQVAETDSNHFANTEAIASSHASLADLLLAAGQHEEALEHALAALAGHQSLSAADPPNLRWQRRLLKDYQTLLAAAPDVAAAREWMTQAQGLRARLPESGK